MRERLRDKERLVHILTAIDNLVDGSKRYSAEDAEKAAAALSALPNLKQLTLAGGENGLSLEQALLVARAAPNAVVSYPGVIYGKRFTETTLDRAPAYRNPKQFRLIRLTMKTIPANAPCTFR